MLVYTVLRESGVASEFVAQMPAGAVKIPAGLIQDTTRLLSNLCAASVTPIRIHQPHQSNASGTEPHRADRNRQYAR